MDTNITFDLSIFIKKWRIIAIVAVVCTLISYCYSTFFSQPSYWCSRAYTIVNNMSYSNDEESRTASINDMNVSRLLVETYTELLRLEEMVSCLSDYIQQEYEIVVPYRKLRSCIRIETQGTTEIMRIIVTTNDKKLSRIISDSIDVYLIPLASDGVGSAEIISQGQPLDGINTTSTSKTCAIGFVFGAVFGAALIFVLYVFNNKVTDEEEFVKMFNIPVLGNIPEPFADKGVYKYGK